MIFPFIIMIYDFLSTGFPFIIKGKIFPLYIFYRIIFPMNYIISSCLEYFKSQNCRIEMNSTGNRVFLYLFMNKMGFRGHLHIKFVKLQFFKMKLGIIFRI